MSASATMFAKTAAATSEAVAEWVKIFPRQVTETYTSSVVFMKQLTVIAVSTITYLKNMFPEESYTSESFGGVSLKILKNKCRDELAQFVSTSLTQAFDAFDKKYLHQLALCFYDGECHVDNLIEYYIFEYTYNEGAGGAMNVLSKGRDNIQRSATFTFDNIRKQTIHLVRACVVVMQTCQYEPSSTYDISLRLYYNDAAPDGYQAPGYLASAEAHDQLADSAAECVKLGRVETPYHRVVARSYIKNNAPSSHEANASQNPPIMTQNESEDICINSPRASGGLVSRCPCNMPCVEGEETLTCDYCATVQHAACFGIPRDAARHVTRHCCSRCSDADPTRLPTCLTLADLPIDKRGPMCIFRRTLEWCSLAQSVGLRELVNKFQLTQSKAAKLMKILQHHGVVNQVSNADLTVPRKIQSERVKEVMRQFFQLGGSENVVDRLLAETLSEGSQPDPVGAVLGPLQKVTLQNETTIGKIIEHTPPDNATDDSTLKQYRQVLLSSNQRVDAELPLSGSHNPVKDMENIGKKPIKRKMDEENRPVRAGMRTKRAKAMRK